MNLQVEFTGFGQRLLLDQKPFYAKIYEGVGLPPDGFNTLRISLDATECSLLNWKEAFLTAHRAIEKGLLILWELQLDVSQNILDDETRFLTLQLNIQHFNDTIWPTFKDHTFGVALYKGMVHSQQQFPFDDLKALAAWLPESVVCFIFLDTSFANSAAAYFHLMDQESCGFMYPILKGPYCELYPWAFPALAWGHGSSSLGYCSLHLEAVLPKRRIEHALCMPKDAEHKVILEAINSFGSNPFRVIPENLLTQEWEGIEKLTVFPNMHPEKVQRQIRGFLAAGGTIIEHG